MPREFSRKQRIAEQIQREVAGMLQREIRDPRLSMLTVSGAEVSRDLAHAKIYVSCLEDEAVSAQTLKALEHASGFLRNGLAKRMQLRAIPRLHFICDRSIVTGEHLISLIDRAVDAETPPSSDEET